MSNHIHSRDKNEEKTNAMLPTTVNLCNVKYSSEEMIGSSVPTSVNIISNLGGKTGQGVATIN